MVTIHDIICEAKKEDEKSMIMLINKFEPIINKLALKLGYDCAKTDLIIFFMKFIHSLKLNKLNLINDGAFVNYIKTSMYREYYRLSRNQNKNIDEIELIDNKFIHSNDYNDIEIKLLLNEFCIKKIITQKQLKILQMKYIVNFTDKDIGEILGISRQAVNKSYRIAIKSIQNYLTEVI